MAGSANSATCRFRSVDAPTGVAGAVASLTSSCIQAV